MADLTVVEKMISEMSDDEIVTLLGKMNAEGKGHEDGKSTVSDPPVPAPQPSFRVRLADGTEIQAGSQEEVDAILASQRRVDEPAPATPARPEFDSKKYHELLINDPLKAQEYMELARTGFPLAQAMPLILAAMGQMTQKLQEIESRGFTADRDELRDPANKAAVDRIMRERGWQPSYQSMQDAFDIASARGMIKKGETQAKTDSAPQQPAQFQPPRVSRGVGREVSDDAILSQALQLTDEQLEALMLQSGQVSRRHLS
jgi:hypothetical protein